MKEKALLVAEAKFLICKMKTIWNNYDFNETSKEYQRRVPDIFIDADVEVMLNEVQYFPGEFTSKYVREYQVKYGEDVFVFELSANIHEDIVHRFMLNVYTPVGDGLGGLLRLITQDVV